MHKKNEIFEKYFQEKFNGNWYYEKIEMHETIMANIKVENGPKADEVFEKYGFGCEVSEVIRDLLLGRISGEVSDITAKKAWEREFVKTSIAN